MFKKILVPLDGSIRAEQAIPVAARLARFSGGTVVLLRVVSPHAEFLPYPAEPRLIDAMIDADLDEARNYLDGISRVSSLVDVHTETVTTFGEVTTVILSEAETQQSDLLVICSHGYTGMKRWVLGSIAEKVVHYAAVPVLLLREGGPALVGTPPRAEGPLRALIPLDGSARAKAALVPAAQLIAALSAPGPGALHLTRVVTFPDAARTSQSEQEALMHKAKQYLSDTVAHIREGLVAAPIADLKLAITWSVIHDDDIATGIIRAAAGGEDVEETGVFGSSNVIAMATHGYTGVQRWALGSITERVLHASRLPLLVVRPEGMVKDGQAQEQGAMAAAEG